MRHPAVVEVHGPGDKPGRPAFLSCNYTCQYLLGGLEPDRFQVQILHEYDNCCFSPHTRHDQMRQYEANIRAELSAADRPATGGHGWFTTTADNHTKHEVCAQDKTIISSAIAGWRQGPWAPGDPRWETIPCDIIHQPLPANCAQNVEPGADPITGVIPPWDPEPKVAVVADKVAPHTRIISRQNA